MTDKDFVFKRPEVLKFEFDYAKKKKEVNEALEAIYAEEE
jgi:hypothetical protein